LTPASVVFGGDGIPGTAGRFAADGKTSTMPYTFGSAGTRTLQAFGTCRAPWSTVALSGSAGSNRIAVTVRVAAPAKPTGIGAGSNHWVIMTETIGGVKNGFSGQAGWSASAGATSYSVRMFYTGRFGNTITVNLGSTTARSVSLFAASSAANANVRLEVTAHNAGGSSAAGVGNIRVYAGRN